MHELDGLLDGDDVPSEVRVNIVNQCGKCGGLSRTRRASDQHNTAT